MKFPVKALKNNQNEKIKKKHNRVEKTVLKQEALFARLMIALREKMLMTVPEDKLPEEMDKVMRRKQMMVHQAKKNKK
jgi:hypothetical protein